MVSSAKDASFSPVAQPRGNPIAKFFGLRKSIPTAPANACLVLSAALLAAACSNGHIGGDEREGSRTSSLTPSGATVQVSGRVSNWRCDYQGEVQYCYDSNTWGTQPYQPGGTSSCFPNCSSGLTGDSLYKQELEKIKGLLDELTDRGRTVPACDQVVAGEGFTLSSRASQLRTDLTKVRILPPGSNENPRGSVAYAGGGIVTVPNKFFNYSKTLQLMTLVHEIGHLNAPTEQYVVTPTGVRRSGTGPLQPNESILPDASWNRHFNDYTADHRYAAKQFESSEEYNADIREKCGIPDTGWPER